MRYRGFGLPPLQEKREMVPLCSADVHALRSKPLFCPAAQVARLVYFKPCMGRPLDDARELDVIHHDSRETAT